MRKLLIAALVFPLAAFAQAGQQKPQQQPPAQAGAQQGQPPGPGAGPMRGPRAGRGDPEQMERRMRVARTLGLAEALDLEPAEAVKRAAQLDKFDEKRLAIHKQLAESRTTLRRAASGEQVTPAEVDQAVQRMFAARGQLEALDREATLALVKDLTPDKRARAVLFLERFQRRFGPGKGGMMGGRGGMRGHMHGGGMGMGMGMGGGMGGGMGMGPGGACPNPDCPMNAPDGDDE